MWDSAPLPAGTPTVTDSASGTVLAAGSGLPAVSGISGPGAAAQVTSVPVSVSGSSITLAPPAAALTGPGVVYPVFIDPTYHVGAPNENGSAWTQIDSGYAANNGNWMESGCLNGSGGPCLQTGFCDPTGPNMSSCGGLGVTRTMVRLSLPSGIPANATVDTADLYLEDVWTAACNAQKSQLWTTPNINSSTDWSNASQWTSELEEESFAGYGSSCTTGYSANDVVFGTDSGTKSGVTITGGSDTSLASTIKNDIAHSAKSQTFGLRAADESTAPCNWNGSACTGGTAVLQWRQWMNTSKSILLQFTWYNPPSTPAQMGDTNGGSCRTSSTNPAHIGNDDVTLYATVGDSDGDTGLTTTFKVYTSGGTLKDTLTVPGTGSIKTPSIPRATIQSWQANGNTTAYTYHYQATTTNQDYPADPTQISPVGGPCYFSYNPADPGPPSVAGYPSTVTFGSSYTVTFTPEQGLTCPGPSNCPVSYSYQIGGGPVTTVSQSKPGTGTWNSNGTWTRSVTVRQLGPVPLNVTSISTVGNPSEATSSPADSFLSAGAALPDGYFTGGTYPDVLLTGTGPDPSLWLAEGTANGKLAAPVDIGSLGNNINGGGTNDGPADWTGTQVLHGDFTGDHVQDVMAYWPAQTTIAGEKINPGHGMVLAGTGASVTMDPVQSAWAQTGPWQIAEPQLCDTSLDFNCINGDGLAEPSDLVAVGDLSEQGTGHADLAGIVGYQGTYHLDLYTSSGTSNGYILYQTLSTTAPDGTADWNNYVLASAELADTSNGSQQLQPDPNNIALFAVDKATGALYWSVNTSCQQSCTNTTLAGQAWTQISTAAATTWPTAWTGAQAATLVSADSQTGSNGPGTGQPEVWVTTSTGTPTATATSYVITGTYPNGSLQAGTASSLAAASNDWPLTDGDPQKGGTATTPSTATDILTGTATSTFGPAGSSTCTWSQDPTFSTVLDTTASPAQCYAAPPARTLPDTTTAPSISLWFKTTSHDGVLASIQAQAVSGGSTTTAYYDPVLYIGNDGKLYGQWWTGTPTPISTSVPVDDGLWHHAQLTVTTSGTTATQTLYLDGKQAGAPVTGALILPASATNLTFAAGYIGGNWPNEDYQGSTGHPDYFNGQIADAQVWDSTAPAQSTPPSVFVPITPVRIMDTRSAFKIGPVTGPVGAGATIAVPIDGNTTASLPDNVSAVAIAVTVTGQTGGGYLTFYPDGATQPGTSNLDFTATSGNTTNNAIVPVGSDGNIAIRNASSGTGQIIVDLTGYFTTTTSASNASTYVPLPDPARILDTRNGTPPGATQLPADGTLTLTIAGTTTSGADIPATGVTGVAVNLTAVPVSGGSGFLTAYPDGVSRPVVTLLNYGGGASAGTINVAVGSDGKIDIYNNSSTATDLVADVSGYYTTSTSGQYYHPLDSTRIINTAQTGPLGADAAATIDSPPSITAGNPTLVLNITATNGSASGYLQAYPSTAADPGTSIVDYQAGQAIANLALVNTATANAFTINNRSSGTADFVLDINGYFN